MKFRVSEIVTTCYEYEVDAESHQEAEEKIRCETDGEHIPEYDKVIDRVYETENLTLLVKP